TSSSRQVRSGEQVPSSRSTESKVLGSGTEAAAAGVDEDQAWSSEALCSSRQAPDTLT
ncbi:hypothetical protein Q5P01_018040, partial [Channa striata]